MPYFKVPWTSKPPIGTRLDWRNPLCRGLSLVDTYQTGLPLDWTGKHVDTGSSNQMVKVHGKHGQGAYLEDAVNDKARRYAQDDLSGITEFTYACIHKKRNPASTDGNYTLGGVARSGFESWTFYASDNNANARKYFFTVHDSGGTGFAVDNGAAYATDDTDPHVLISRFQASVVQDIWLDGKFYTERTATLLAGPCRTRSEPFQVAGEHTNTTNRDEDFYLSVVWTRALTDAEIVSFSKNPWQVFEPREIPYYVPSVGGGGGTTHEVSLSMGATATISPSGIMTASAASLFGAVTALVAVGSANLAASAAFTNSQSVVPSLDAVLEGSATLDASNTVMPAATTVEDATVSFTQTLSAATTANAIFEEGTAININGQVSAIGGANIDETVALAANHAVSASSIISIEGQVSLAASCLLACSAIASLEGQAAFGVTQALIASALAELEVVAVVGHAQSITVVGGSDTDTDLSISVTASIATDGTTDVVVITTPGERRITLRATDRKLILQATDRTNTLN